MALLFREAHAAPDKKRNQRGVLHPGERRRDVVIAAKKGKRGSVLGVIDPGFMLQPGEKIVVVSGVPERSRTASRRRAKGCAPIIFSSARRLLHGQGTLIRLAMNQVEVARLLYDPATATGVA